MNRGLSRGDLLAALTVVIIWGLNFVVMKRALTAVSPMMLGALRFAMASLPLLWLVPRPRISWRFIASYGLLQGLGQFGLLFTALHFGMPSGLASTVLQAQVLFTVLLAIPVLGERARLHHGAGLLMAAAGLALIAASHGSGPHEMTLLGFVLTLSAALSWAGSNLLVRLMGRSTAPIDPFQFIVWSSAVSVLPFLAIAVALDGAAASWQSVTAMGVREWAAVAYLALLATLVGYSLWMRLLQRHAAGRIAPFSLLVPVVGLWAGSFFLSERLSAAQWSGVGLVLAGLLVNQFGGALSAASHAGRRAQAPGGLVE
ncbi:MAG: O-acetylserine/cysteine exporter [Burkholderiales bacterium PBB1]|nr:MAG: O-acetylserine/cysteine exporter [Burkholderiales bacterium PBB1]